MCFLYCNHQVHRDFFITMYVYVYVCVYVCINTHTHTHTHKEELVGTSQRIRGTYIMKTHRLMLRREIMAANCKNRSEHINVLCGKN
jgi:hypothetical protein